jgi:hypothetical protein
MLLPERWDLGDLSSLTISSELFIYNPQLLLTMPDQMKHLSVSWEEVAQAPRTLRTHPF